MVSKRTGLGISVGPLTDEEFNLTSPFVLTCGHDMVEGGNVVGSIYRILWAMGIWVFSRYQIGTSCLTEYGRSTEEGLQNSACGRSYLLYRGAETGDTYDTMHSMLACLVVVLPRIVSQGKETNLKAPAPQPRRSS